MIGKWLASSRNSWYSGILSMSSKKNYNINDAVQKVSAENLPQAPANPYKKRPLKLVYDKNEYYSFRLPSEQSFLLGSFDHDDLFGTRKGIDHSPLIKAQTDLDSNLVWLYFLFTVLALATEVKYHDEYVVLRENLMNHDMGKFEHDDFK